MLFFLIKLINSSILTLLFSYETQTSSSDLDITFKTDKKINIKDDDLESLKIISNLENEICVSYEKNKINIEELINLIKKNNVKIEDISTDDGDLEDVFLRLIKN